VIDNNVTLPSAVRKIFEMKKIFEAFLLSFQAFEKRLADRKKTAMQDGYSHRLDLDSLLRPIQHIRVIKALLIFQLS